MSTFRIAIGILFLFSPLFAQDEILTDGTGAGTNRDEAIMAAKRDAIEKNIDVILENHQLKFKNYQSKRDFFITKFVGSVKDYQVLSEKKNGDGTIQIEVRTLLSKHIISKELETLHILFKSIDKPKIMVIVNEQGLDNMGANKAETAIITFLKDTFGFNLIEHQVSISIKNSKLKMATLAVNEIEAATIGSQYGAEVLIIGTATSKRVDALTQAAKGMISVQADVVLKAINCATGQIIDSSSANVTKMHFCPQAAGTQAVSNAAVKTSAKLLDPIIKDWQNQKKNGIPLKVTVNKILTVRSKNAIVQTFKGLKEVSAVHERKWDSQSGTLIIDIQYKGTPSRFRSKIDGYKMKFGGGSLSVTGINGQIILLAAQAM